ncbi:uncharacterized protein LOC108428268 [Pygocentrus nattereri]|uniref:uncharacterized protein LOC108428268 n=1 Tax=Pygocentrus nattereri TaxID=42514 RepID=UPI000814210D|nr:uncharacterized protein LOC108428268 [Pygocentrus nattereri]
MAKFKLSQCVCIQVSVAIVTLLPICITVVRYGQLEQREKRSILASTEIPVEHIDPASIDLTPLVNTLISAAHKGSQHLFSVLSVTSHSSLALHKLTLLVYNISDFQDIESSLFPMRYCYCVTNKTNDLTDFTAILLDVMGNSSSYLQELFKSSSILSVSQRNSSDCIYICVMAGKTDRDLSQLWDSVPPLFNHTIIEDTHIGSPNSSTLSPVVSIATQPSVVTMTTTPIFVSTETEHSDVALRTVDTSGPVSTVQSTSETIPSTVPRTPVPSSVSMGTSDSVPMTTDLTPALITARLNEVPTVTTAVSKTTTETSVAISTEPPTTPLFSTVTGRPTQAFVSRTTISSAILAIKPAITVPMTTRPTTDTTTTSPAATKGLLTDKPGCPWRSELFYRGSQREDLKETLNEDLSGDSPTVSAIKLQPCVFELCKFFSQCLCRGYSHKTSLQSYCIDSHFWYEKHTVEVCSRMRRVAFSRNLKQKCLARMCVKM